MSTTNESAQPAAGEVGSRLWFISDRLVWRAWARSFASMRALVVFALTTSLVGCASVPEVPRTTNEDHMPSLSERRHQLNEAALRAAQAGDTRPYPEGWPSSTLPLNHSPEIAESIQVGQNMAQVAAIMGREGWSQTEDRRSFLKALRETYQRRPSSHVLPPDLTGAEKVVPERGTFVRWEYQGFPSTADWIVVFFASAEATSASEPKVVARGVFRLGCL